MNLPFFTDKKIFFFSFDRTKMYFQSCWPLMYSVEIKYFSAKKNAEIPSISRGLGLFMTFSM